MLRRDTPNQPPPTPSLEEKGNPKCNNFREFRDTRVGQNLTFDFHSDSFPYTRHLAGIPTLASISNIYLLLSLPIRRYIF